MSEQVLQLVEKSSLRAEVPGSDIIAMGLAVSEDRASEPVLADFAFGSDGMPRAVRLVNAGGTF